MHNEVLLDIGTFLARRWSGNRGVQVIIADRPPTVNIYKKIISLPPLSYFAGSDFVKYRQWRANCWKQAMKIKYSNRSLSVDYAHGFLLNCLEEKRVQLLGLKDWPGMNSEMIFNEGMVRLYEPSIDDFFWGSYRKFIAFAQYFRGGWINGDPSEHLLSIVQKAADYANSIVEQAITERHSTDWLEKHVPKLLKMLETDALLHIPILSKAGLAYEDDMLGDMIEKILRVMKKENVKDVLKKTLAGDDVKKEFEELAKESYRVVKNSDQLLQQVDLSVPERMDIDVSSLYNEDLINKLKAEFRNWKVGWIERHHSSGDEFDEESYIEKHHEPFFTDIKITYKANIVILLDHSSSISHMEQEYKRATVALCKALDYLGVKFSVFAFNTQQNRVKCWVVKPPEARWSNMSTIRLAQIAATGGTPLSEVYERIRPLVERLKPEIFLTLTDGEPSDPEAVRSIVQGFRIEDISMVSIGIGKDIREAVSIAMKLKSLGYNKSIAISNLNEMPKKILQLLG
ncbi:MAG: VWA domain-containing protein [Nitrososphaerales archaeon]